MSSEDGTQTSGQRPYRRRSPLTAKQILELGRSLTDIFLMIREMRDRNEIAKHIKYPPLPAVLSESIVIVATPTLFGSDWTARFGGRVCDIVLTSERECCERRVEVKATGHHAFQELKAKDLRADFLVWIRFSRRFETGHGPIEAAVLEFPGNYIMEPQRLDIIRFEAIPGVVENQRQFRFDSLEDIIEGKVSQIACDISPRRRRAVL